MTEGAINKSEVRLRDGFFGGQDAEGVVVGVDRILVAAADGISGELEGEGAVDGVDVVA